MQLPGGVWKGHTLDRSFSFKEVTGEMEMTLAELSARKNSSVPACVTTALTLTLKRLAGLAPTWRFVHRLSVADRQFLMRCLSGHLGLDGHWQSIHCGACQSAFDFQVSLKDFPIKPAGRGYPFARVKTSAGTLRVRVPSGEDQEAVCKIKNEKQAMKELAFRLVLDDKKGAFKPEQINESDVKAIESAVEDVSPELVVWINVVCPVCGKENRVSTDPYNIFNKKGSNLFWEIHKVAAAYHWSEKEILAIPKHRRLKYLYLIDRQRGLEN